MGNHAAGRAMVQVATELRSKTALSPLEVLDIACEPFRNTDAEFDGACEPDTPFGRLLFAAFQPGVRYDPKTDEDGEWWWENVREPFRKRYDLW